MHTEEYIKRYNIIIMTSQILNHVTVKLRLCLKVKFVDSITTDINSLMFNDFLVLVLFLLLYTLAVCK